MQALLQNHTPFDDLHTEKQGHGDSKPKISKEFGLHDVTATLGKVCDVPNLGNRRWMMPIYDKPIEVHSNKYATQS